MGLNRAIRLDLVAPVPEEVVPVLGGVYMDVRVLPAPCRYADLRICQQHDPQHQRPLAEAAGDLCEIELAAGSQPRDDGGPEKQFQVGLACASRRFICSSVTWSLQLSAIGY